MSASSKPSVRPIDLTDPLAVHIVGIGGTGMRAIARVLLAMGHSVSGSDRAGSVYLDELADLGASVHVGQAPQAAAAASMVTRSSAVPDTDTDVAEAMAAGVPVYSRAEMLAAITALRPAILVAGTHGKTTTSSMLSVMLDHAGLEPSFVIGSDVERFGSGARWGDTEWFVVEADESDGTFLVLPGSHAIVTSLDPDHLEFYGTADRLEAAFVSFVENIAGTIAVCIDDPDTGVLVGLDGVVTYGEAPDGDLRLSDVTVTSDTTDFDVHWRGKHLGRVSVGLPGHHNALNASAALALALTLELDFETCAAGLAAFGGVARRFETRGEHLGVRFVDDYAHLPAEVEAAVATATQGPWNRVIAAYQPHRFSRTEALGATFATSFLGVDQLVLTDIYPSGESPRPGVTGRIVYDAVVAACPDMQVVWQPTLEDVADYLASWLGPGDLCLTLGAGDLTTVPDMAIEQLRQRSSVSVDWLRALEADLPQTHVIYNAPLGVHTTYRVGGAALALLTVDSLADLTLIARVAGENNTPILPIGKGSNMLIADHGFDGVAIMLGSQFETIEIDGTTVTLGAAASLPVAARRTVAGGLVGFEWAVGVPGSVGGAIVMNAGGHGSDMSATVTACRVVDLSTGKTTVLTAAELDFGYRRSAIGAEQMVIEATMELSTGSQADGEQLLSEIVRWRRANQPGGQNAGSVFRNPADDSAGRLIDAAGGKGTRIGSAEVSVKHANFIQADPAGTAADVLAVMLHVRDLVRTTADVELHAETRMIGFGTEWST